MKIDAPLEFWALVVNDVQAAAFSADRAYGVEEIQGSRAGQSRLSILPRGVGRIEVSAPTLFSEIRTGETTESRMTIRNTGTQTINGWTASWTLPAGAALTQVWNGRSVGSGQNASVRNETYNGTLGAGATTSFGFTASGNSAEPATVGCTSP